MKRQRRALVSKWRTTIHFSLQAHVKNPSPTSKIFFYHVSRRKYLFIKKNVNNYYLQAEYTSAMRFIFQNKII
jgi:hypothetical protein